MSINDTQATALAFLVAEPATAGEIFRQAQTVESFWNVTRSQLYREMPKLTEGGLVKASEPGVRNAVMYRITAAGKKALSVWLAEEGQVIVRDGNKAREHFRTLLGADVQSPKKRARRQKVAENADA